MISAFIVLGLLGVALWLFATEKLPIDMTTLILLVCLVLAKILSPQEVFDGFSSDIIIILASLFVITGALQRERVFGCIRGVDLSYRRTSGVLLFCFRQWVLPAFFPLS